MFGSKDARQNVKKAKADLDDYYDKHVKKSDSEDDHPEWQRRNKKVNDALDELKASRKRR